MGKIIKEDVMKEDVDMEGMEVVMEAMDAMDIMDVMDADEEY